MERADEQRLLKAARRGEEGAFLLLFDKHHRPLYRFAFRLTRSESDAEDIVQECFLSLLRRRNGFDATRSVLRTYLFGAVRNQALKRIRGRGRVTGESPAPARAPAPEPPASLRRGVLAAFPGMARRKVLGVPMRWAVAFALGAVGIGLAAAVWPYEPVIARGWSRLAGGTYLRCTTLAQPPASIVKFYLLGSGSGGHDGWQQRYLWDRAAQTYFGYEMRVEPLANAQYRIETRPLSRAIGLLSLADIGHYREAPVPPLPAPRVVRANEPFEVDLLARDGERVYDVIQLSPTLLVDDPAARPPDPQATSMRLSLPRLYRNGAFVAEGHIDAAGPTVWFYLPGQGRWLVALARAGNFQFRQAGYVDGNTIKFQWGDDEFRIESREPVASGGVRPLFVLYQQDFRMNPKHPKANDPTFGSAGAPMFHYFTPKF